MLYFPSKTQTRGGVFAIPMDLRNWPLTWLDPCQTIHIHSEFYLFLTHTFETSVTLHTKQATYPLSFHYKRTPVFFNQQRPFSTSKPFHVTVRLLSYAKFCYLPKATVQCSGESMFSKGWISPDSKLLLHLFVAWPQRGYFELQAIACLAKGGLNTGHVALS